LPYIKPAQRAVLDPFIDNLIQAISCDVPDGKLNYVISRLVASSYAPYGQWSDSTIQRAKGLFDLIAEEFEARVANPHREEMLSRNGDIPEYEQAHLENFYRGLARQIVDRFPATGTYKRSEFDQMISNQPVWDRQGPGFTDRLHKDGYVVMGKETVTLGLLGLELAKHRH
jgi:hypothetical protein